MSLTKSPSWSSLFTTARSNDRAVLLWALTLIISGGLALTEGNPAAAVTAVTFLPLLPERLALGQRAILLIAAMCVAIFGFTFLAIAIPVGLLVSSVRASAPVAILGLATEKLLIHHFQSVPEVVGQSIHTGSIIFLVVPILTAVIVLHKEMGWSAVACLLAGTIAAILALDLAGARWVTFSTLTSPIFRTLFVLLPLTGIIATSRNHRQSSRSLSGAAWLALGFAVGASATLLLPTRPISSIAFDESHGHWETVIGSFGPNDFGRSANYTYTALYSYAAKLVGRVSTFDTEDDILPDVSSAFVLKMPSKKLSVGFSQRLDAWVRAGGRLLVVADHTDLYDSSQNLNAFLYPNYGIEIGTNAVFDARGMPTAPATDKAAAAFGFINASSRPWAWQTGASLSALPLSGVELANFGVSFSEPGDYSRPNRFGPFLPRTSLRFGTHTAVMGLGVGSGAIIIVLDSTPWSNFSIFLSDYKRLFSSILTAFSKPAVLQIWGWSAIFLGVMFIITAFFRSNIFFVIGGIALGVSIGCAASIGMASFVPQMENRDFGVRIVAGERAKLEFLKQLVAPGERNFVRILSAMGKYDLEPSSSPSGSEIPILDHAKSWLLIQPDARQLPQPNEVFAHLSRGGNLSILFAPEQAADAAVRTWLNELGLIAQRSIGLSIAEDARTGGLLNRRGATLLRDVRTLTVANQTSKLKDRDGDQLIQSYTVRPTTLPRSSGLLNLGFSSDQFADDAIGEIWEGIYPSAIGKLREQQLAAVLQGSDAPLPMPADLKQSSREVSSANLGQYLLLVDGKSALAGNFLPEKSYFAEGTIPAPIDNPVGYLEDLRSRSIAFISASCPKSSKITQCNARLLGSDMLEWMVSWASSDDGKIMAVELLHERRFSGLGSTLNVIFTN